MDQPIPPEVTPADRAIDETLHQDERELARAAGLSVRNLAPPAVLAGYDVQHCLGNGAYGSVWLAIERNTGKQVAIKFYSHRRGIDWSLLNREVEKLAVLCTSRDIVGLLQVGWDADPPYYVMEYLKSGSLAQRLEPGPLPVSEAVRIATAVTSALVHAHQHSILHCDVKPANVLLDGDLAPRLADFGQSRLSHEQSPALGTLFYMAPEQADLDAAPDPRWDVYALGALLYHMLCGEPPYRTPQAERQIKESQSLEQKLATYRRLVEHSPRPAKHRTQRGVDSRLAQIVDRCLAADPRRRYATIADVAEALAERERFRSLRPMIWLGIVLPGLLLASLFPLAVWAVTDAAATAEKNIADRALESDAVSAKILAYSLNDDLDQRLRTLSQIADDEGLRALMPGATQPHASEARLKLQAYLQTEKDKIDEIRQESNSDLDKSWFLTDAQGYQRWRDPNTPGSLEKNFAWRDYFHGQGADHREWQERRDVPALDRPHISVPFRSTSTEDLKIALSVPVRDSQQRVIGVLGRTIQLGKLLGSYKRLIGEDQRDRDGGRVLAILDLRHDRGSILDHPWMTLDNLKKLDDDEVFDRLTLWPVQQRELEELRRLVREGLPVDGQNLDRKYYDPVRKVDADADSNYGMPWLAAFWPVGDKGWFAVVQERRDEALRPVSEIQQGLFKYALTGLILCLTFVATSWYFVSRVMRPTTQQAPRPTSAA
ncbi:MAG: serine/threonine protein kinase [Planctomycetaceae bacterium]|nr:serine/threonine protein kinase [Planctomycetaceae bacterium]